MCPPFFFMKYLILVNQLEPWEKTFLVQLLAQSKIALSDCFISNDKDILKLVTLEKTQKLISMSEYSLTALTGKHSLEHWRGSQLSFNGIPVIPMYGIETIGKMYKHKLITLRDMQRLKTGKECPHYNFILNPTFDKIQETLSFLLKLRSEEHTSELQSPLNLVCRLLLEK